MADTEGKVEVYESSDGGTGDPAKTNWQFFVNGKPVTTGNHFIAETMRLAIETDHKVRVTFNSDSTISQARIQFQDPPEDRALDPA